MPSHHKHYDYDSGWQTTPDGGKSRVYRNWSYNWQWPPKQPKTPKMYPYYRGPSRLLWFAIGVGAATWWHRRAEQRRACMYGNPESWAHCGTVRVNVVKTTPTGEEKTDEHGNKVREEVERVWEFRWPPGAGNTAKDSQSPQTPAPPMQAAPWPQAPAMPWDSQAADNILADISRKTTEALTQLTGSLQDFNSKLAEREKVRMETERRKEQERLNPPKMV